MAELQPIIVFHGRHFVRHLGICNPIRVKLLQVMSGVIMRNLTKNDVSILNRFPGVHKRGIYAHAHTHTHTHIHTHTHTSHTHHTHTYTHIPHTYTHIHTHTNTHLHTHTHTHRRTHIRR